MMGSTANCNLFYSDFQTKKPEFTGITKSAGTRYNRLMDQIFTPKPDGPVLVIGSAAVDVLSRVGKEIQPGVSNPARIRMASGGVARNVAENLARLGQTVTLLTAVGDDEPGRQIIDSVAAVGVDVDHVAFIPDRPTASYLAVVGEHGELQFALDDMRITRALNAECINERADLFKEASMLFVDANLPRETLKAAITLARKANIPVAADPTSVSLAPRLMPFLSHVNLVVPNLPEAEVLCASPIDVDDDAELAAAAKCLVGQGVEIAIITLAEKGLVYATSETSGQIRAIRTRIVDPTGGGDALTAAVIFALLNNIHLDDAMRLGISAATLTLQHMGAVLPTLSLQLLYDELVI